MAEVAARLLWYGFSVYCPGIDYTFFLTSRGKYLKPNDIYENDLRILKSCQAVYALPNVTDSSAVKTELKKTEQLKIPIFANDLELLEYFDKIIKVGGRTK